MPQPLIYIAPANGGAWYRPLAAYPAVPDENASALSTRALEDEFTNPNAENLAKVQQLYAPRGRAWQTDETRAQWGSTVFHGVLRLMGEALSIIYETLTRVRRAYYPALAEDAALKDWEHQYGLPDPCLEIGNDLLARRRAVRAARTATDGLSRIDLLRLLKRSGAVETTDIYEERGFECGLSECGGDVLGGLNANHQFFVTGNAALDWLSCGQNGLETPLGVLMTDLPLCVLERAKPAHTQAVFVPNP